MTADGHIVVSHDPSALRMAGVDALFRDVALAEVRTWDAGYGFVDVSGQRQFVARGYRFVTLEAVLAEFPGVPLNVDIKQSRPSMVSQVIALLRRTGSCERVTLASFHTNVMLTVRRNGYDGPTALSRAEVATLLATPGRLWRGIWRRLGGAGLAVQIPIGAAGLRLDTRSLVDKCHALDMRIDYWTINRPDQARRLLELGADGIMTDDPAALKPVFDELVSSRPIE